MKVTKITKRLGRTISNKATFSSVTLHNEVEVVLEPGEIAENVEKELYLVVAEILAKDVDRVRVGKKIA